MSGKIAAFKPLVPVYKDWKNQKPKSDIHTDLPKECREHSQQSSYHPSLLLHTEHKICLVRMTVSMASRR